MSTMGHGTAQRYEVMAWLGPAKEDLSYIGMLDSFVSDAMADPDGDWIGLLESYLESW